MKPFSNQNVWLAISIGAVVTFLTLLVLIASDYRYAKRWMDQNGVQHQVEDFLAELEAVEKYSRQNAGKSSSWSLLSDSRTKEEIQRMHQCEVLILDADLSSDENLLSSPSCDFIPPTLEAGYRYTGNSVDEYLLVGAFSFAGSSIVFLWLWIGSYCHAGWRRLSLLLSVVVGVLVAFFHFFDGTDPLSIWGWSLTVSLVVGPILLVVQLIVGWVVSGFRHAGK